MKAHLLRSKELSETRFDEIVTLMRQYPGLAEFESGKTVVHLTIDEGSSLVPWAEIWKQCDLYREAHKLKNEDAVIILTDIPNERNWFSAGLVNGERNFFVHTSYWEKFVESSPLYPIASELAFLILQNGSFENLAEVERIAHQVPRGCVFDFCGNKEDISLRLRTADICPDCRKYLKNNKTEPALLRQVFAIMEGVRGQMLFRERLDILDEPSSIFIDGWSKSIWFTGIGNLSVKLDPKHLTVYHFFLKHKDGVAYREMEKYENELQSIYRKYSGAEQLDEVSKEIEKLIYTKNNLSTIVSDIHKVIKAVVDKRIVSNYLILGPNGKRKKIALKREFVSYSGDTDL